MTKILASVWLLGLLLPMQADAKTCWAMKKELAELRLEYHEYANGVTYDFEPITFEKLVEILDKIVKHKRLMRESDCKIPPRQKDLKLKKSTSPPPSPRS